MKCYKDTIKASPKDLYIPIVSWEHVATERSKWRCLINKRAAHYEELRIYEAERKHRERKTNINVPPSDSL